MDQRKTGQYRPFPPWPYGQAVKTRPFHGRIPGSSPGRVTINYFGQIAHMVKQKTENLWKKVRTLL